MNIYTHEHKRKGKECISPNAHRTVTKPQHILTLKGSLNKF